jgi:hypothetical protein
MGFSWVTGKSKLVGCGSVTGNLIELDWVIVKAEEMGMSDCQAS